MDEVLVAIQQNRGEAVSAACWIPPLDGGRFQVIDQQFLADAVGFGADQQTGPWR